MSDLSATDRCVKCGLCLPHCPTFRLTGIEADSPRGRISLIQAMHTGNLDWSPGLFRYLDRCLQCRACEAMCPSGVPFGRLMDSARARMEPRRRRSLTGRWLRTAGMGLLASPARLRTLGVLARGYQRLGLRRLAARLPGLPPPLRRLNRLLPARPDSAARPAAPVAAECRGCVDLFRGCVTTLLDPDTLDAARRLLETLGYRVNVPVGQGCCGALHQHNGDPVTAARLAQRNTAAFGEDANPVLVTASGCATQLREYGSLYGEQAFGGRVSDILQFLLAQDGGGLSFDPRREAVAVHLPCSHRNVLGHGHDIIDVLRWIPGLQALPINPEGGCCGAAGSYMLSQPELADRLRDPLLDTLAASGARILVTTNIGCSLHLQAGLEERGVVMEVLHPVVLLERQLKSSDAAPPNP